MAAVLHSFVAVACGPMMRTYGDRGQARTAPWRTGDLPDRSASPRRIIRICLLAIVVVLAIPYLLAPLYRFVDPVSTLMIWRRVTGQRVERHWVPLSHIAPALRLAALTA